MTAFKKKYDGELKLTKKHHWGIKLSVSISKKEKEDLKLLLAFALAHLLYYADRRINSNVLDSCFSSGSEKWEVN